MSFTLADGTSGLGPGGGGAFGPGGGGASEPVASEPVALEPVASASLAANAAFRTSERRWFSVTSSWLRLARYSRGLDEELEAGSAATVGGS